VKNDIYFIGPGGKPLRGEVIKKDNAFVWVRHRDALGRTGRGFKVDPELTCPVPADGSGPPPSLYRKALPYIVPELPTRRDSLKDQLDDLRVAAFLLGMDDAVNWIDRQSQSQIDTKSNSSIVEKIQTSNKIGNVGKTTVVRKRKRRKR
jgi:hypothetical protein